MIGQTETHSQPEQTQTLQHKNNNIKKKPIHKDKNNSHHQQDKSNKLTKEQKARIQKQKNREAAQRSRDTHKQYVHNLEKQVSILRQQLQHSKLYCYKCQQPLTQGTTTYSQFYRNITLQDEPLTIKSDIFMDNQILQHHEESESFLRWFQPQEELPFTKIMLLVCMVVIAIMVGGNTPQSTAPRVLLQKYQQPALKHIQGDHSLASCVEQRGLVELHKGMQDQKCLDSLMRVQVPSSSRKSLRSLHENTFSQQMQNIMVCSLRTPRLYDNKSSMLDSAIYRLFVSGSDIKQMGESSESIFRLTDRNIQLNGIYKLNAQIKSVQLLTHHSCIV